MALLLNEDQQMLKDAAAGLLAGKAPVSELRRLRDERDAVGFSRELWREMAQMGWAGMVIPEQYGGLGFGYVGLGQVLEMMGRNLSVTPLQSTVLVAATLIMQAGSEQQCSEWLPKIAAGKLIASLALEEGRHHRPDNTALQAAQGGDGYRLNGQKLMVLDGHVAELLLVVARTSAAPGVSEGLTVFAVPSDAVGLTIEAQSMVDSRNAATVTFSDVAVSTQQVVGEVDGGYAALRRSLDIANIGLSAELLGLGLEAFERTVEYLLERRQFDVPIGSFQALQHRAADLYCELELCKSLVLKSLQAVDEQADDVAKLASMTKAKLALVSKQACYEAIQMHGGIGMTDAFDIGFFLKRAQVLIHTFGDANYHLDRYGRLSDY